MGNTNPLRAIKRQVHKKILNAAPTIAYEIAFEIQSHYDDCIQLFYKDYDPKFYNRTYNTYYASDGAEDVSKCYQIIDGGDKVTIRAGIQVGWFFMNDWYLHDSPEYVFPRTWELGIHGTSSIKVMSPSPKERMDKWFDLFAGDNGGLINKFIREIQL